MKYETPEVEVTTFDVRADGPSQGAGGCVQTPDLDVFG